MEGHLFGSWGLFASSLRTVASVPTKQDPCLDENFQLGNAVLPASEVHLLKQRLVVCVVLCRTGRVGKFAGCWFENE